MTCEGFSLKFDKHCESFPNGPRIYIPILCGKAVEGDRLCGIHLKRKEKAKKDPNYCQRFHGYRTEGLPKDLYVYDTEWYWENVKKYGEPSEDFMGRAKKANETVFPLQKPVEPPVEKPMKAAKKPVEEPVAATSEGIPKKPTKRRPKQTVQKPVAETKVKTVAVEKMEQLKDIEVIRIVVRPFSHKDTSYFRDSAKNKLYSVGTDKKPSRYVGRWNPETETIDTEFPDSDAE